jgi:hypothetical protein
LRRRISPDFFITESSAILKRSLLAVGTALVILYAETTLKLYAKQRVVVLLGYENNRSIHCWFTDCHCCMGADR